jgi:hypothetical protein
MWFLFELLLIDFVFYVWQRQVGFWKSDTMPDQRGQYIRDTRRFYGFDSSDRLPLHGSFFLLPLDLFD